MKNKSIFKTQSRLTQIALVSTLLLGLNVPVLAAETTDERLTKIEDRLQEIEIQKLLNKFNFSGVFINRFEYFHTEYGLPLATPDTDTVKANSTSFALNIDANISSQLKFYSTLGMSKFWNNEGRKEAPGYWSGSEAGSSLYGGSTPQFDRAYFSYKFDFPLTVAIGRMPTNNGLPINQLDGLARQGTYPRLAFNAIFDGLALVYDFSSLLPQDHNLSVRAFYTPYMNASPTDRTRQLVDSGAKVESNTPMYNVLTEYSISNLSWASKINISHMLNDYRGFYWDGFNNPNDHTIANPDNPYYEGGFNMGYIGVEDLAHIGLNASVSGLFYWSKVLNKPNVTNQYSTAYLASLNQSFGDKWVVGGEYIKTDENFYLDEWTYLNIIPFYKTPNSKGTHLFVSKSLVQNLVARVGYYNLISDPCGPNSANPFSVNEVKSDSYYLSLRLDF